MNHTKLRPFIVKVLGYFPLSPFLVKLHWLPVRHIILYKTLLLAHKAIHHDSHDYLASILKLELPTSTTTHATNIVLLQLPPKHNLDSAKTRAWQYPSHTPGSLSLHPSVLHHLLQTTINFFKRIYSMYIINFTHIWTADCFISTVCSPKTAQL